MKDFSSSDAPDRRTSFLGRRWAVRTAGQGEPHLRPQNAPCPADFLANCLLDARGLTDPAERERFLNPKLINHFDDLGRLRDLDRAADRLAEAILSGEQIGIWSDYDADGITSAAILLITLNILRAAEPRIHIPDRIRDGYGPNTTGLLGAKEAGCSLVCILDSGTTAFEPLAAARAAGLDVMVIDHHGAEDRLPEAVAVVNPNRRDETPGLGHLCTAGLTLLLSLRIVRALVGKGHSPIYLDVLPRIMGQIDLAAIGTVCDVVPLTGLNRVLVSDGLKTMNKVRRPGVSALLEAAGLDPRAPISEREIGWVLGPRINAAGRIGDPMLAFNLLSCPDFETAKPLAETLEQLNTERQRLERQVTSSVAGAIGNWQRGAERRMVLAVLKDAHEGVVGISAARIREATDAPTIILTVGHDGNLKGSARSVPGFDIGAALIAARQEGLLLKGGGHPMAGGLTVDPARLPELHAFLDARVLASDYGRDGIITLADLDLPLAAITAEGILALDRLAPWGTGNETPVMLLRGLRVQGLRVMKEIHAKLRLSRDGLAIDGLMWGVMGTNLAESVRALPGATIDVLGTLSVNRYMGHVTPQIVILDLRLSGGN